MIVIVAIIYILSGTLYAILTYRYRLGDRAYKVTILVLKFVHGDKDGYEELSLRTEASDLDSMFSPLLGRLHRGTPRMVFYFM